MIRAGEGPLVVFCNGLALPHEFWDPVLQLLPGVPAVVFDRPRRPADYPDDIDTNAAEIDAALSAAGWTPDDGAVVIVGHSFGGLLAEAYAHVRPGRVGGLVLVDPTVPAEYAQTGAAAVMPTWRRRMARAVRSGPVSELLRGVLPWTFDKVALSTVAGRARLRALPPGVSLRMSSPEHVQRALLDDHRLPSIAAAVLGLRAAAPLALRTTVMVGALGPLPLRRPQQAWLAAQEDQVGSISTHAELIALAGGHLLMLDCPGDVAAAIIRAREACAA